VSWRIVASIAILALLAWVGFEIGRAGGDIQVARIAGPGQLSGGRVVGKRLDGKSWSLDYDTVTMSPDNTIAAIAHVRDGHLHRPGKPDVHMRADNVQVNTFTNDFIVTGNVHVVDPEGGGRTRTFATVGARYLGGSRELTFEHPVTITDGSAKIVVSSATVNFRTGDITLGALQGSSSNS